MNGLELGFRLSNRVGSFGLSCGPAGLSLAGVPLLQSSGSGFTPRPQAQIHWLVTSAYGRTVNATPLENGLAAVSRALDAGEIGRAMIAAVLLKLPELDWQGAARLAHADNALAKYDPDELRDDDGRWTTALTLPPGHRIDELGDLLEWIANAQPEDAPIIRREIKRYYYDVGDVRGGNALNEALSNVVYGEPTKAERQDVLDTFEIYTRADPAEIAQIGRDLLVMGLSPALSIVEEFADVSPSEVWNKGWAERGIEIEDALGGNLRRGYRTIDELGFGVATSIKSIDLRAATYQSATRLTSRINRYVDSIAKYVGDNIEGSESPKMEITARRLKLAVPRDSITNAQNEAIEIAKTRAKRLGVDFNLIQF